MAFFKYAFYAGCNIFSAFVVLISVFYATTFLNDFLIPGRWTHGQQMMLGGLIAVTEAAILLGIAYVGNWFIATVLFPGQKRVALLATAAWFVAVFIIMTVSAYEIYWQRL